MAGGHAAACVQLEQRIKTLSQTESIFHPELRRLRLDLQAECQAALTVEFEVAQVSEGRLAAISAAPPPLIRLPPNLCRGTPSSSCCGRFASTAPSRSSAAA
jgi:hypothetical protein